MCRFGQLKQLASNEDKMRSNSPNSLTQTRSNGSVRPSLPLSSNLTLTLSLLDSAAEQLMVQRDFPAAFDTCEIGLRGLISNSVDQEDSRYGEVKAALCILGIQALAELNQWPGVLSWILQQYDSPEKIPTKIMQMCILLYTKVGEQVMVQEAGRAWLHCPSNRQKAGFGTVAELYLLHVLMPLGCIEEAKEMITREVGSVAFTEDQRRTALDIVEVKESQAQAPSPQRNPSPEATTALATFQGAVALKLAAILRLLCRRLSVATTWAFPVRRVFLAVVLLYMLFVRMDPALPSAFPWISRLLQLLKHMWNVMFAPYYWTNAQSKGL